VAARTTLDYNLTTPITVAIKFATSITIAIIVPVVTPFANFNADTTRADPETNPLRGGWAKRDENNCSCCG
jgi:hypothetical protein